MEPCPRSAGTCHRCGCSSPRPSSGCLLDGHAALRGDRWHVERVRVRRSDVRITKPAEEDARQERVRIGHGADRVARAAAHALLVDDDRRRQASSTSTSGRASVGYEALHERAVRLVDVTLRLGRDRAEDERALARPGHAVNTVSRRLGSSSVSSLRLFTRAPWHADRVVLIGRARRWRAAGRRHAWFFWGAATGLDSRPGSFHTVSGPASQRRARPHRPTLRRVAGRPEPFVREVLLREFPADAEGFPWDTPSPAPSTRRPCDCTPAARSSLARTRRQVDAPRSDRRRAGLGVQGGARVSRRPVAATERRLGEALTLGRGARRPKTDFFLRAESMLEFATRLDALDDPTGARTVWRSLLHRQSHGESFLSIINHRFGPNGLYLLDERIGALPAEPARVVRPIHDLVAEGCQFIISTHAPILLALPKAGSWRSRSAACVRSTTTMWRPCRSRASC